MSLKGGFFVFSALHSLDVQSSTPAFISLENPKKYAFSGAAQFLGAEKDLRQRSRTQTYSRTSSEDSSYSGLFKPQKPHVFVSREVKIAITGGIGSGKSAVSEILRKKGQPVFSCDEIYADLCGEEKFLNELNEIFSGCVKDGKLDRKALSKIVFSNEAERERLNAFSHPRIMERLMEKMSAFPLSFAEVPLLFESGVEDMFDSVIVVMREKSARMEAIKRRDGLSEEEILLRMSRQFGYEALPEKNCYVIENNGSLADLEQNLAEIVSKIV